jgi:hypothetical protein
MRSVRKSGRRVAASESAARRECPFSAPRPGRETGRVDVTDLDGDPLRQLSLWLDAARAAGQPMPEAMTIATATSDGVPSARLVVLRGLRRGLVFFTDGESEKGADLAANPRAAAVLHWLVPVHRQVRVAGSAERVGEDEVDEYWSSRPPPSVSARPPRGKAASSPAGRSWKRRPGTSCGVTPAEPVFPGRCAGAVSGCCHPASSSGRNHRTACTTGSATAPQAAAGSPSGYHRNRQWPRQKSSSQPSHPAHHLLQQPEKRGAKRSARNRSKSPNLCGAIAGRL